MGGNEDWPKSAEKSSDQTEEKPFRVLLTGAGPFANIPINPSWLAVKPLSGRYISTTPKPLGQLSPSPPPSSPSSRPILVSAFQMHVAYEYVLKTWPPLHGLEACDHPVVDAGRGKMELEPEEGVVPEVPEDGFDLFIHVGVGKSGNVALESLGRRWNYVGADVDGKSAPIDPKTGNHGFPSTEWDVPEDSNGTIPVRIDVPRLREYLHDRFGFENVRVSDDAGNYLCGFMLYGALACTYRAYHRKLEQAKSEEERKKIKPTPAMFIHVPPLGKPYNAEELTTLVHAAVWGILNEGMVLE